MPLDAAVVLSPEQVDEVVAIDVALTRLAEVDAGKSQVFEMRFFGGLSLEETAAALVWRPARSRVTGTLPAPGCVGNWGDGTTTMSLASDAVRSR